jgi:hypothetical protein
MADHCTPANQKAATVLTVQSLTKRFSAKKVPLLAAWAPLCSEELTPIVNFQLPG